MITELHYITKSGCKAYARPSYTYPTIGALIDRMKPICSSMVIRFFEVSTAPEKPRIWVPCD